MSRPLYLRGNYLNKLPLGAQVSFSLSNWSLNSFRIRISVYEKETFYQGVFISIMLSRNEIILENSNFLTVEQERNKLNRENHVWICVLILKMCPVCRWIFLWPSILFGITLDKAIYIYLWRHFAAVIQFTLRKIGKENGNKKSRTIFSAINFSADFFTPDQRRLKEIFIFLRVLLCVFIWVTRVHFSIYVAR